MTFRDCMGRWNSRKWIYACVLPLLLAGTVYAQSSQITSVSPSSASIGSPDLLILITGTNFDSGARVYWGSVPPAGAPLSTTFLSSTQLSATVPSTYLTSQAFLALYVRNSDGTASNTWGFTVSLSGLQVSTTSLPQGTAGTAYRFSLAASGGTMPYTWSVTGTLPSGLSLASDGTLSGTPVSSGTFNPVFQVADARQVVTTKSLALVISAPAILITTASPLPDAAAGQPYSQKLAVSGGSAPYQWTLTGNPPAGLSLDAATGVLSGTPSATGNFTFTARVTDKSQLTASKDFTLTVTAAPLSITTVSPLFNGSVGQPYSQVFSATGGTPPYRWSITSGQTGGLTLDPASGTLSGTPKTAGTFTFTALVTDSNKATSSKSFSLVVNLPTLTITTTSPLPNAKVGAGYSQTFTVVGGVQPYSWSLGAESVPGLTIDAATGILSGTPTDPGTFALSVVVKDSTGATATRTFSLTVDPAPLKFTTASQVPDATVGTAYSQNMTVSGGVPPFTWSSNGLPEGLVLDASTGAISGTPTKPGAYSFTVRVTDSAQNTVLDLFRIDIGMPPIPAVTITGLSSTMNPADQATVHLSLASAYTTDFSGQLVLTFTPDSGGGDDTILFSTGGRSADFTIPAGSTDAIFTTPTVALQTGTVAGNILVSANLQALGSDVTPDPAPSQTVRVERAAPSITSAKLVRDANGFTVEAIGFSTTREISEAKFHFTVSGGQTLQNADVTVPIGDLFNTWFQDAAAAQFGGQFKFTQPFTVQGNAGLVNADTITLTNSVGSTTVKITQ